MNILNQTRAYLNGGSPTFKELIKLLSQLNGAYSKTINAEDYLEASGLLTSAILKVLTSELEV